MGHRRKKGGKIQYKRNFGEKRTEDKESGAERGPNYQIHETTKAKGHKVKTELRQRNNKKRRGYYCPLGTRGERCSR